MSSYGNRLHLKNISTGAETTDIMWVVRKGSVVPVQLGFELSGGDFTLSDGDFSLSGFGLGVDVSEDITQVSHGFSVGDAVYYDGTDYQLADASNIISVGTGIVSKIKTADNFYVTFMGLVPDLSGLSQGEWYYVSESTPGLLTTAAGTTIVNPIGRAFSSTELFVFPMRADQVTPGVDGLTTRSDYDSVDTQYFYTGRAATGTATSAASWKISRYDFSTGTVTYADGDELYDNVYDNRESLSYS